MLSLYSHALELLRLLIQNTKSSRSGLKPSLQFCFPTTLFCIFQSRSHEFLSPQPYFGEKDDIDLFFPDGTWCHNDGSEDYFCLKHQCISESQSRQPRKIGDKPEVQIFQNAQIEDNEPDKTVIGKSKYWFKISSPDGHQLKIF